ncbi:hypothetical protein BDY24DRAFT_375698 [Mrakia frigida]|uniref:zinc finger MYND domain-containing protein n=1 Tax=Mrakia frigida TaxID=29902 RepID=UPI003FCC1C25
MPLPSHTEVAQLLGLSPGEVSVSPKKPTSSEIKQLVEMYQVVAGSEYEERLAFAAHFNAEYLPSLIRTLLVSRIVLDGAAGRWWQRHVALLNTISPPRASGCLQRFLRTHPAEAQELYLLLINGLGAVGRLISSRLVEMQTIIVCLADLGLIVELGLVRQLPSLATFPELVGSTRKALTNFVSDLDALHPVAAQIFPSEDLRDLKALLFRVLEDKNHFKHAKSSAERMPGSWWRCEAKWEEDDESKLQCVQMNEGEEMMACSRCLTIRYCSKEHQRHHWKSHKRICVKPLW